jgi:hypothetical protein
MLSRLVGAASLLCACAHPRSEGAVSRATPTSARAARAASDIFHSTGTVRMMVK